MHIWGCQTLQKHFKYLNVVPNALSTYLTVFCQDAEGLPVEVKVRSKGDGLYACSYTATSPLKHTLAITWGGVSIPNSPYRVSSQSQHPVTTGSDIPAKSEDPVEAESVKVVQSELLVKTESNEVQSEPSFEEEQSKCEDVSNKSKKPLIIIKYTEERCISQR